jgi:hypothetical protein
MGPWRLMSAAPKAPNIDDPNKVVQTAENPKK